MKIWKAITPVFLSGSILLSACSAQTSSESGEVVVGTWGGDYQQFLTDHVHPALEAKSKELEVVYATEDQSARMTKMKAETGGTGTYDVVHLADYDMQQMINANLLTELDSSKMPNSKNVIKNLENPYFIPHIYSASVLVYNENNVKPSPESWSALWDPKYKGKIGIVSLLWTNWVYAAAAVEGLNNGTNWDDAWDTVEKLKEMEPKVYASQEELGQALQTGEVWMSISFKARAVQWSEGGGEPLASVVPKEGSYPIRFGAAIPANAPNPESGYKYLDAMLDAKGQGGFAEVMGYAPTIEKAEISDELMKKIGFTSDEAERIKSIDLKYVAENNPIWKDKFDRFLASK